LSLNWLNLPVQHTKLNCYSHNIQKNWVKSIQKEKARDIILRKKNNKAPKFYGLQAKMQKELPQ
jgi:hypothetical protein